MSVPSSFYTSVKMKRTECSERSAFNIQTPGKCPEENMPYLKHGGSLKTTKNVLDRLSATSGPESARLGLAGIRK
jgi:hypothetical protein